MSNSSTGNKLYVDSTGVISDRRQQVAYILFTPNAANDQLILKETSDGDVVLHLRGAVSKDTKLFRFPERPLVFANGIFVDTITSGATALVVTTEAGK